MQHAFGLKIPQRLEEVCDPARLALIVYDMQVGILPQLPSPGAVIERVTEVLDAAREGGYRVFFCRHMSLPNELAGSPSSAPPWPGSGWTTCAKCGRHSCGTRPGFS
jgi:nicotinamidase-related amidase